MKLFKNFFSIFVIFLLISSGIYSTVFFIIRQSFAQVEKKNTLESLTKVLHGFDAELNNLTQTTIDYAYWNDTYEFVQTKSSEYTKLNFSDWSLLNLNINIVIIFDANENLIFVKEVNENSTKKSQISSEFESFLKNQLFSVKEPQSGILNYNNKIILYAIKPILNSEKDGIGRGSLFMGRYLDEQEKEKLEDLTQTSLVIEPINSANLSKEFKEAKNFINNNNQVFIKDLNFKDIAAYTFFKNNKNQPIFILKSTTERKIYQQQIFWLTILGLFLLFLSLVFSMFISLITNKMYKTFQEHHQIQKQLNQETELAQITLNSILDAVICTDENFIIKSLNPVAEKLTGWKIEDARFLHLDQVYKVYDYTKIESKDKHSEMFFMEQQINKVSQITGDKILISKKGDQFAINESVAPIKDDEKKVIGFVIVFRDVTKAQQMAYQLAWQAIYDSLTHLINRQEFENNLHTLFNATKLKQTEHTLCLIDLDHFKYVNDTCGHRAGDELLRQLSHLLKNNVRNRDIVARLGGDEFGIIFVNCSTEKGLLLAQTICNQIKEFRFFWEGKIFKVSASIGLVAINSNSISVNDLLSAADIACYASKHKGRGQVQVYDREDGELVQHHSELQWIARINQALLNNHFCLFYQKIVSTSGDRACDEHYEVLLRLVDELGNILSPGAFLPAAERYNLMPQLDRWVIETLFSTQHKHYQEMWHRSQNQDCHCLYTINLSGSSINDEQLVEFIYEQFKTYQIPAELICFEITETTAITNLYKAAEFIEKLKALGCKFALDDFGTGMSSFTYLKSLPVDYLKIDGSFIKDITKDNIAYSIVDSINRVAKMMNIQTIAEFVSNEEIMQKITDLKVDYAQGYFIGKPELLSNNLTRIFTSG